MARPLPRRMARGSNNMADGSKPDGRRRGHVRPIPERVQALTISTPFPNEEFGSSAKSLEPTRAPIASEANFVSSARSVIGWLKTAAIGCAWTAIFIAGSIMAALFALDLMDMLRW